MSILNCASSASVYRGYDYYFNKHVTDIIKINSSLYEGYVNGNTKNAYYVKIDIEHPRKFYCDCPHATGNTVCKHMVALYFSVFPQEAEDYNDWMVSKYSDEDYDEDEYDEYEEDDYYYDDYRNRYSDYYENSKYERNYIKPLFFDEMLKTYINKNYIPGLLLNFEMKMDDEDVFIEYCFYDFIINGNERALYHLEDIKDFDKYMKKLQDI